MNPRESPETGRRRIIRPEGNRNFESRLAARLAPLANAAFPKTGSSLKSSAVLVPLLCDSGKWHLLFTLRCDELVKHGGQIAFPGGLSEPGEVSPVETALRETCEELGVSATAIRPLRMLDHVNTTTGYLISPVVGVLAWPLTLTLQESEVREAFPVPVDWLQTEGKPAWREVTGLEKTGRTAVFLQPFEGRTIWGATAKITCDLLVRIGES
jgi:8-oxo-dGTP pyrophosphatase MutT (NUDIX family)